MEFSHILLFVNAMSDDFILVVFFGRGSIVFLYIYCLCFFYPPKKNKNTLSLFDQRTITGRSNGPCLFVIVYNGIGRAISGLDTLLYNVCKMS